MQFSGTFQSDKLINYFFIYGDMTIILYDDNIEDGTHNIRFQLKYNGYYRYGDELEYSFPVTFKNKHITFTIMTKDIEDILIVNLDFEENILQGTYSIDQDYDNGSVILNKE